MSEDCFGIDLNVPLALPPPSGRLAFVTAAQVSLIATRDAADARCAQEASLGGLAGTFRARLPLVGEAAATRFDLAGPVWSRIDGVALADSPLQVRDRADHGVVRGTRRPRSRPSQACGIARAACWPRTCVPSPAMRRTASLPWSTSWLALAVLLGLAAPSPALASDAPPRWTIVGAKVPTRAVYTVEWTFGIRAVPLTLPRGTAGMVAARSIVEDDPTRTETDVLFTSALRIVRGLGRHIYLGGEYEMGHAGSHTPITVDHPATPHGMSSFQVVAIAGLRANLDGLAIGAELATGGRLLTRDYEGDRDLEGFESLTERGAVFEARVRAGIWTSPYWQVGAVYGRSLLDDAWTIGLYLGPTSRPFGR